MNTLTSKGTKSANSRVIHLGEYDKPSILHALAFVGEKRLKEMAQEFRERTDWYGRLDDYYMLNCIMEIVKIHDPKFETEFIPGI